jgi:glycosyltransferase involved in cell wall biosynthesis
MKILFILPEYGSDVRGGIATYYSHLLPTLVRFGACIHVVVTSGQKGCPSAGGEGITVTALDDRAVVNAKRQLVQFAAIPSIHHLLAVAYAAWESAGRGEGFDVVETTDFGLTFVPWLASPDGPPVIVQLHGSSGQVDYHDPMNGQELSGLVLRLFESALLGRADEIQSYGRSNALEWSNRLGRSVEHIWPAWRSEALALEELTTDFELEDCGLVIGRIQSWKGPDVLCSANALLGERAPTIMWVGRDNSYLSIHQSMAAHLSAAFPEYWGHTVRPLGELSRDKIAEMLRVVKFVIVPSKWDTFNLSAVEAMRTGKVVICSEGAGVVDLIEDGKNGFRFPSGNAERLADLIAKVDSMTSLQRDAIGALARETIKSMLDADGIAALRMERYSNLAAAGPNRKANLWCRDLGTSNSDILPFGLLDQIPLRPMVAQIATRTLTKIRKMLG